jgi:hypothetical protein
MALGMALGSIIAALALTASVATTSNHPSGLAAAASFCGPKQAFGIGFGSREMPGMHMSVVSTLVPLPADYRPFSNAEVVVTLIGRRRHTVHAEADFESEGRAQDALAAVKDALIAQGWVAEPQVEVRPTSNLYSDKRAMDAKHPNGRIAELFTLGSRLYFSCSDADWKHRADKEMPPPSPPARAAR